MSALDSLVQEINPDFNIGDTVFYGGAEEFSNVFLVDGFNTNQALEIRSKHVQNLLQGTKYRGCDERAPKLLPDLDKQPIK